MRRYDITGQRFGRLTAIRRIGTRIKPSGQKYSMWLCRCDCGKETPVRLGCLSSGNTSSCGCFALERIVASSTKHGQSRNGNRSYGTWVEMRSRCEDVKNDAYHRYGGRGIAVCDRWQSFANFYADMGERPKGKTLERIDNSGPYSPENCTWATYGEQARNRRSNILITHEGRTQCLKDWCSELGVPYDRIRARIKVLGHPPLVALGLASRS